MSDAPSKKKKRIFVLCVVGILGGMVASGLHWVSSLPNISVADGNVTIANCGEPRQKYAKSVCPKLFCKKALIDGGLVPPGAEIRFVKAAKPDAAPGRIQQGAARYRPEGAQEVIRRFQCEMDGDKVEGIQFLDPAPH